MDLNLVGFNPKVFSGIGRFRKRDPGGKRPFKGVETGRRMGGDMRGVGRKCCESCDTTPLYSREQREGKGQKR